MRNAWKAFALAVLAAGPAAAETVRLELFVPDIPYVTKIANAGDGTGRLFFATQPGLIHVHDNGALLPEPFLDLRSLVGGAIEDGLLGLAFHPDYASNRQFYVFYTRALDLQSVVVRYRTSASDPDVADPASASLVLTLPQTAPIHNGGELAFGPDGYLYVSTGENGVSSNAQSLGTLLGKILRIDVDGGTPYAIPPGNPFVGVPGARPEIIAYGLRNPWRMAFDHVTGDLWIGDNAESGASEVDVIHERVFGQNFGWPIVQGDACWPPGTACSTAGLTPPTVNTPCGAIVGGFRYRGTEIPALGGTYVFACFGERGVQGARQGATGSWSAFPLTPRSFLESTFGVDESGDLLVANWSDFPTPTPGIYRVVPSSAPSLVGLDSPVILPVGEGGSADLVVELSAAHLQGPVTVGYTTLDGTARAGEDYVAAVGTLTFQPGEWRKTIAVPLLPDELNEGDETFSLRLQSPGGVVLGAYVERTVSIDDDDPPPLLAAAECSVVEGNAGATPCAFALHLDAPSGRDVVVRWDTITGTAGPGDYEQASGDLTFAPGETQKTVSVNVLGDVSAEGNESFVLSTFSLEAVVLDPQVAALIVDDDAAGAPGLELVHGARLERRLANGVPHLYRLAQNGSSSYEVVVDALSGDADMFVLERVSADGATVLQAAAPSDVPFTRTIRLRWQTTTQAHVANERLRVQSNCSGACGGDDTYRIRFYETSAAGTRFNNRAGQATVIVLQNLEPVTSNATIWFWAEDGVLLRRLPQPIAARGSLVLNTSTVGGLATRSGSVTVTHDGGYGALAGKLVSLDPATGLAFDTPLVPRPR